MKLKHVFFLFVCFLELLQHKHHLQTCSSNENHSKNNWPKSIPQSLHVTKNLRSCNEVQQSKIHIKSKLVICTHLPTKHKDHFSTAKRNIFPCVFHVCVGTNTHRLGGGKVNQSELTDVARYHICRSTG